MELLDFTKPKRIRSTNEHNKKYQSDSGVAGTYVPNMSEENDKRWKAKHITGKYERIEIRKNMGGANVVIVVNKKSPVPVPTYRLDGKYDHEAYKENRKEYKMLRNNIKISANGRIWLSFEQMSEIQCVINEATIILFKTNNNDNKIN